VLDSLASTGIHADPQAARVSPLYLHPNERIAGEKLAATPTEQWAKDRDFAEVGDK